jgi:hypothetical protein
MNRRIVTVVASILLLLAALTGSWMTSPATPMSGPSGQLASCTDTACSTPMSGSLIEDLRAGALMSDGPAQFGNIDMLDAPAWRAPVTLKATGATPPALPHVPHPAPYLGTLLRPPENTRA